MAFVSYAQNFEDVMLWRALKHVSNGFYIDVGANHPTLYSVTRAFYERGWHGVNIEPVKHFCDRLVAERARDINLNVAVGERSGVAPFFNVLDSGLATLNSSIAENYLSDGWSLETIEAQVVMLSSICRDFAPADIHFLKIDVEGAEREALAGMDFGAYRPWILVVEATMPNSMQTAHESWEPIVLAASYRFVYFDGLNRYYVANEHDELVAAFAAPPNVFDGFILNADQESHLRAEEAGMRAYRAQERAQAAEVQSQMSLSAAAAAEARTSAAEERAQDARALAESARLLAENAETKLFEALQLAEVAERRSQAAEQRTQRAERRAEMAKRQAEAAEQQTHAAEQRTQRAEQQSGTAKRQAEAAEQQMHAARAAAEAAGIRTSQAEQLAHEMEALAEAAGVRTSQAEQLARSMEALAAAAQARALSAEAQARDALVSAYADAARLSQLRADVAERDRLLAEVHASFSVRVTAPLRSLANLVRRANESKDRASPAPPAAGSTRVVPRRRLANLLRKAPGVRSLSRSLYVRYPVLWHRLTDPLLRPPTRHSTYASNRSLPAAIARLEPQSHLAAARPQPAFVSTSFVVPRDENIDTVRLVAAINERMSRAS